MIQSHTSFAHPAWQWPLDLGAYDRSPILTPAESSRLTHKVQVHTPGTQLSKRSWKSLGRLLQPLDDALGLLCSARDPTRRETIRAIAMEMCRRQTPFWAWSLQDWLEMLQEDDASFAQHYGWMSRPGTIRVRRYIPMVVYLLCPSLPPGPLLERVHLTPCAEKLFGKEAVAQAIGRIRTVLQGWGYRQKDQERLSVCISYLLLRNRDPSLEHVTLSLLEEIRQDCPLRSVQEPLFQVSRVLKALGIIEGTVENPHISKRLVASSNLTGISQEWLAWCERWRKLSTLQDPTGYYNHLRNVGRWLHSTHPEITTPGQWTIELAAEFIRAVVACKVGEWSDPQHSWIFPVDRLGQPLRPASRVAYLSALRRFFGDCQEWGWIPFRFNVQQVFRTPRAVRNLIGPQPRVIDKEFWAKLLWAAMNLEEKDLPLAGAALGKGASWYPLEMHRAVAMVWCFAALRSDEVARLRVGCIRWQYEDVMIPETGETLHKDAICFLDVPVNKTSTSYTKAVHLLVGKRIQAWEQVRPKQQLRALDKKTSETVQFLFSYRGERIPQTYVNRTLIPILCKKAGIPLEDSRGKITSHRARATIASQLYNAKEPLSIFELKEYLGHKYLSSTQRYLQVDPTKLASKVAKSGYFEQNMATIEVLLDQEAVMNGAAARGAAWKFYDLGHGFCTNPFWAECAHRMACARCPFYRPKDSLKDQLVEGKANLVHMLEFVSLTDEEKALVTEGVELHQELIERLADVPTPAGPTPRELAGGQQGKTDVIPLKSVRRSNKQQQDEQ